MGCRLRCEVQSHSFTLVYACLILFDELLREGRQSVIDGDSWESNLRRAHQR